MYFIQDKFHGRINEVLKKRSKKKQICFHATSLYILAEQCHSFDIKKITLLFFLMLVRSIAYSTSYSISFSIFTHEWMLVHLRWNFRSFRLCYDVQIHYKIHRIFLSKIIVYNEINSAMIHAEWFSLFKLRAKFV